MASKKKLLQAAAGSAGGGTTTDVDDVFSTFLYDGNNEDQRSQGINNGIALGNFGVGSSTDFDGTANPLRRTSALSGAGSSKEFTLSAWIQFKEKALSWTALYFGVPYFALYGNENQLIILARNSSSSNVVYAEVNQTTPRLFSEGIWYHILISVDVTNSSNRYIYINDVAQTVTWTNYVNDNIDFTASTVDIADATGSGYNEPSKQAHLYLDTTYRDLSTTSNRRIFIDANGGSTSASSLAALNPILYLPMTNDYAITKNLGTGGDFTNNGSATIDTTTGTEYDSTAGQGGLVWFKMRDQGFSHRLVDTERGVTKKLETTNDAAEGTDAQGLTSFNSNGFTVGSSDNYNLNNADLCSWTFRKAPRFFDIQTWTGTGSARTISHNLGQVPGIIIVKRYSATEDWNMFHRSLGNTKYLQINGTGQAGTSGTGGGQANLWNDTDPTATEFSIGTHDRVNTNGQNYIAYIFAHNDGDGEFGPNQDQDIIKCGTFTNSGSGVEVNLGFEPQFMMFKRTDSSGNWCVVDEMRGIPTPVTSAGDNSNQLRWNLSNAENAEYNPFPTPTGFKVVGAAGGGGGGSGTFIYMAIRRGPLAAPESATDVFAINTTGTNDSPNNNFTVGFDPDLSLNTQTNGNQRYLVTRLLGNGTLKSNDTAAVNNISSASFFGNPSGTIDLNTNFWGTASNVISWSWKRAPSYFDVVAWTGAGGTTNLSHNLGVVPEMIWARPRSYADHWSVFHKDTTYDLKLDGNDAEGTGTAFGTPTSSVMPVTGGLNVSPQTYIAYLFATVAGVSKVGSVAPTGSALNVDCGFSSGARFVLMKRTDSSGEWFVWDSVRGIVAGNDPYLYLDSTSSETTTTDYIDPHSSGFTITSSFYGSGSNFIFYAIAA